MSLFHLILFTQPSRLSPFLIPLPPPLPHQAIKARVREMEEEAERLRQMQSEVEKQMNLGAGAVAGVPTSPSAAAAAGGAVPGFPTLEEKMEADNRLGAMVHTGQLTLWKKSLLV